MLFKYTSNKKYKLNLKISQSPNKYLNKFLNKNLNQSCFSSLLKIKKILTLFKNII